MRFYIHSRSDFHAPLFFIDFIVTRQYKYCTGAIAVLWFIFVVVDVLFNKNEINYVIPKPKQYEKNFKILLYAPPNWISTSVSSFRLYDCRFKNCNISCDKSSVADSDLVIFHHNEMNIEPPTKTTNQKWVFWSFESSVHTNKNFKRSQWKNKFDMTMSYRQDSQGYAPYNKLRRKTVENVRNYSDIFKRKKKDVAWIVSHCETSSKREQYVSKMKTVINVDVYGRCGKPCKWTGTGCLKNLSKDYKFYLSFENSICEDYVTEKVFNVYNDGVDIIPIVRGAPNIKGLLPNGTFISTLDFNSPKELAKYLKMISLNETKYVEYLKTKDSFVTSGSSFLLEGLCSLCTKLNKGLENTASFNLLNWFSAKQCRAPNDLN